MTKAIRWIRKNTVLCIALLAAVATTIFVPPDRVYLSSYDF